MSAPRQTDAAAAGAARAPLQSALQQQRQNGQQRRTMVTQGGLDKIVKLELFKEASVEQVGQLWTEYHKDKPCLSAIIAAATFDKLDERARAAPMFVFPMPKGNGFESWLWAHQDNHALITTLEEYKQLGANAAPHLHITFYDELKADKGVVLMRSQAVDTRYLSTTDAQYLANAWQLFVLDDERYKLMHDFNHNPAAFDFDRVVALMDQVPSLPDSCTTQ